MMKEDEISWPPPQPRSVDVSQVELHESHGHAYLRYRPIAAYHSMPRGHRQCKLQSVDDLDHDYESASDSSKEDLDISTHYTGLELAALQADDPAKFKRCIINIDSSRNIYAKPLDHSYPRIMIAARKLCGHAFHGDEVLVKIFDFGKKLGLPKSIVGSSVGRGTSSKLATDLDGPWAKTVGIFKHAMSPKYCMFVCRVEDGNTGVMVPLNRGVPKIFNLEWNDAPMENGKVTIYAFTKAKQIIFHHYQKVHDVNSVLFVVRYLKWEDHFSLPLGIVISVLLPGVTVDCALRIIDIEYSIPQRFCEAVLAEVKMQYSGVLSQFLPSVLSERSDCRNKLVFTIDPTGSSNLDDALSFEVFPDGTSYIIGVHISDVSYFVTTSSSIDNEARQRGSAFYPALGDFTPMLPPHLGSNLCSFLPHEDRLTVSVYIKVNVSADILGVEIKRSIVRSQYQLSYSNAEAIINGAADDAEYSRELTFAVVSLYRVAQLWRNRRLGREALYMPVDYSTLDGPKAHKLVEEMMIVANHQVALYLLHTFPSYTALQRQSPPDTGDLEAWKSRFLSVARHSVVLSRPYCVTGDVCRCRGLCECLPSVKYDDSQTDTADDGFELTISTWSQILSAFHEFDNDRLQSLVMSPEFHPHQAVALCSYQTIEDRSIYQCSGELETDLDRHHHSLNVSAYVQFTSPLHCYMDLVTHRLVACALDGTGPCYSESDLAELCTLCNDVARRTRQYHSATAVAHFCDLLMKRPLLLFGIVDQLTDVDFQLLFPAIQLFFPSRPRVKLSSLSTASQPVIGLDSEYLLVTWSQRIYDCQGGILNQHRGLGVMEINSDQYTFRIPPVLWTSLLLASVDDDADTTHIAEALDQISLHAVQPLVCDPTSEGSALIGGAQFTEYSLKLRAGMVVMVQLSTELHRGLLRPCIQLFHITPSTCVCVEHITSSIKCFCEVATKSAARRLYSSAKKYKKLWLPVLAMESVHWAVANQHSVIIHNVDIRWTERHMHGEDHPVYLAMLQLPASFCEERCVRFAELLLFNSL